MRLLLQNQSLCRKSPPPRALMVQEPPFIGEALFGKKTQIVRRWRARATCTSENQDGSFLTEIPKILKIYISFYENPEFQNNQQENLNTRTCEVKKTPRNKVTILLLFSYIKTPNR